MPAGVPKALGQRCTSEQPSASPVELSAFLPRRPHAPIDVGGEVDQGDALGRPDAVLHPNERQGDIAGRNFTHEIVGGEVREEISRHPFDRDHRPSVILRHEEKHGFHGGALRRADWPARCRSSLVQRRERPRAHLRGMIDVARLNSLLERVADATAPERGLFAEVFFACAGKQHPDIKAHFAMRMDAQAWTEAALILTARALPGWRVQTNSGRGLGKVILLAPNADGLPGSVPSEPVHHAGGVALAMLMAVLRELGSRH